MRIHLTADDDIGTSSLVRDITEIYNLKPAHCSHNKRRNEIRYTYFYNNKEEFPMTEFLDDLSGLVDIEIIDDSFSPIKLKL